MLPLIKVGCNELSDDISGATEDDQIDWCCIVRRSHKMIPHWRCGTLNISNHDHSGRLPAFERSWVHGIAMVRWFMRRAVSSCNAPAGQPMMQGDSNNKDLFSELRRRIDLVDNVLYDGSGLTVDVCS